MWVVLGSGEQDFSENRVEEKGKYIFTWMQASKSVFLIVI